MTDKEIEKALEQHITTGRCVGSYRNCKGCPLENISVCNYRVSDFFARYKDQIRKDTAKEILQDLKGRSVWFIAGTEQFVQDHFWEQFAEMCEKYGVEIDDKGEEQCEK